MTPLADRWVPRLLCLVGFYFTIEETFVKWTVGSGDLAAAVRQVPDLLIVGLAISILILRVSELRLPAFSSRAPAWMAVFAVYAIVIIAESNGDPMYSLLNLKAFLRYSLLFVILHYFPFDARARRFLWNVLFVSVLLQAAVCAWQYVGGDAVRDLLVPKDIEAQDPRYAKLFTGAKFAGINDLVGTMGNNIGLSYFLVVTLVVWLARTPNSLLRLGGAAILIGWNILTGSRAGVVASGLVVLLHESRHMSAGTRIVVGLASVVVLVVVLMSISTGVDKDSLLYVFNPAYLHEAANQRLGLVMYLVPQLAFSPVVLFGLGPDKFQYPYFFEQVGIHLPRVLMDVIPHVIEDVYWVAIVVSYGAIGASVFMSALFSAWAGLGDRPRTQAVGRHWLRHAGRLLIAASLVLALFSQAFHLRQFSYFFWLLIAIGLQSNRRYGLPRTDVAAAHPGAGA